MFTQLRCMTETLADHALNSRVNQISTGEDMWLRTENRLLTYREFCDMLRDPEARVWLDRILMSYLETGRGERNDRANNVISSIQELVTFLDHCVGGGGAITSVV